MTYERMTDDTGETFDFSYGAEPIEGRRFYEVEIKVLDVTPNGEIGGGKGSVNLPTVLLTDETLARDSVVGIAAAKLGIEFK